jgi:hypothetical protein
MFTIKAYKEDEVEIFSASQVRDRQHIVHKDIRYVDIITDEFGLNRVIFVAKELPEPMSLSTDSRYDIVYIVNEQNVTVHTVRPR